MIFAILFTFWRFAEIVTLIPLMGMLAYFVHIYVDANVLTPNYILILFIVSVLGLAWAVFTLFSYHRSSSNARFVSLVDLGFVGALIAGVYYLRFIANADCASLDRDGGSHTLSGSLGSITINTFDLSFNKSCAMLKACFAFGIMNTIFFFITAVVAFFHGDRAATTERRVVTERHHSHRRRSHSGSHHSRRSSHSHHRTYV
ncbi:hypothetical protein B0T26DRAFT_677523 [Lasiosphaeria miniovina]|uniref:MARVEL domain-containing protein n=1 Tax=Lasiosphaeria miniovina TaxID=1954250 RepID=A0AA40DRR8_9PEZI|nr:uncharacterized protein B0T26DRAFT_677523 [Lasiosphaeria miniovina]KAK0713150.1 hypothetical protein B0T26DRAFT_677523 [Lasiosphaeria miniovina]